MSLSKRLILFTYILQKSKKPPGGLYNNLFFASETILIFGGLFLHRLSRLLKIKFNWIKVTKTELERQKLRTRRYNQNSSKPSWKARNNPPKCHTKIRYSFLHSFKGYDMPHTIFKIVILRISWI